MIVSYFNWCHSLGMHLYTLPTIITGAGMAVMGLVHWRNQRKRDKDFEEKLEDKLKELNGELEDVAETVTETAA